MNLHHDSIIFDLDGTLWDSTAACATAWNSALTELKYERAPLLPEDIGKMMGLPIAKIFEKFFPEMTAEMQEKAAKACFKEEIEIIKRRGAVLYSGVQTGLAQLSEHYKLYIVSNCQQQYLNTFFGVSGLKSLFKDTECHGNTLKPKSHNIQLIVSRNGLKKPVYIGDTAGDQEAAQLAGVSYFHVNYGFGVNSKPCMSFDAFSELVTHFMEPVESGK